MTRFDGKVVTLVRRLSVCVGDDAMGERSDRDRDRSASGRTGGGINSGGVSAIANAGTGSNSGNSGNARSVPRDAHAVMGMMKELGVTDFDPRCVTQLLEFAHRYVTAVLEDARVFAAHAKKKSVEADDVRLAAAAYAERAFTAPPPRELLLELTRGKNLAPLPLVKPHCGLRLPPDRFCLSACNYRLSRARRPRPSHSTAPSGPQSQQNQTSAVKRPGTLVTVPKTQAVNVPKPVFKFASAGKGTTKPVTVKMEVDTESAVKRKREDDDYDAA